MLDLIDWLQTPLRNPAAALRTLHSRWHSYRSSIIIAVNKKPDPSTLNDFRPVALTSLAMKCLEELVHTITLWSQIQSTSYPRSVDEVMAMTLHYTFKHMDCSRTYVRMFFLDCSLAFNSVQTGKLIVKLIYLGVFLTDRPQVVRMEDRVSAELTISTGTPQGCCLIPNSTPGTPTTVSTPRTIVSSSSTQMTQPSWVSSRVEMTQVAESWSNGVVMLYPTQFYPILSKCTVSF